MVERYYLETRTIMTRVGEFVLSLKDMVHLTGLRIHGDPLTGIMQNKLDSDQIRQLLGPISLLPNGRKVRARSVKARLLRTLAQVPGELADHELRIFLL